MKKKIRKMEEKCWWIGFIQNWKDMGLIFPAWLEHYVPPALCTRISLSWNTIIRGQYGNPDTLQNAYI